MEPIRSPRWNVEISSFRGSVFGAEHYYGKIRRSIYFPAPNGRTYGGKEEVTLISQLTDEQAKANAVKDGFDTLYHDTERFNLRADVVKAARMAFEMFGDEGDWCEGYLDEDDDEETVWGAPDLKRLPHIETVSYGFGQSEEARRGIRHEVILTLDGRLLTLDAYHDELDS